MQITINDESREITDETTVSELLVQLELDPKYLAVERNLEIVPRAEHAACVLQDGDRLEIVTLVGGG